MIDSHYRIFLEQSPLTDEIRQDILHLIEKDVDDSVLAIDIGNRYKGQTYKMPSTDTVFVLGDYLTGSRFGALVKNSLRAYLAEMLTDPHYRTAVIRKTSGLLGFMSGSFSSYREANLCRDADSKLFTKKELKHYLRSHQNARFYLGSAIVHGDRKAIEVGQSLKANLKYQGDGGLIALCGQLKITPHPDLKLDDQTALSPSVYLKKLMSLTGTEMRDFIASDFREELLLQHGDLIFESLFRRTHFFYDDAANALIKKLVEMGVDWYAGLINAVESPLNRIDLATREKNPLRELNDLYTHRAAALGIAAEIFKAQPLSMKVELCSATAMANKLFSFTKDDALKPFISKHMLKETLKGDLGM